MIMVQIGQKQTLPSQLTSQIGQSEFNVYLDPNQWVRRLIYEGKKVQEMNLQDALEAGNGKTIHIEVPSSERELVRIHYLQKLQEMIIHELVEGAPVLQNPSALMASNQGGKELYAHWTSYEGGNQEYGTWSNVYQFKKGKTFMSGPISNQAEHNAWSSHWNTFKSQADRYPDNFFDQNVIAAIQPMGKKKPRVTNFYFVLSYYQK